MLPLLTTLLFLYKKLNVDLGRPLCLSVKPYTVLAMSNHSSNLDSLTLYVTDFFEISRISRFRKGLKSASEVGKSILGHFRHFELMIRKTINKYIV